MAARGAGAAGRADAAHRRAHEQHRNDPKHGPTLRRSCRRLQQLGWTDGHNVRDRLPLGRGQCRRYPQIRAGTGRARARRHPGLGAPRRSAPVLQATRTVPIVFAIVTDPVGAGFVESLARPGGNATGFIQFEYSLSGKWLELLKQVAPGVTRAAVLRDPGSNRRRRPVRRDPVGGAVGGDRGRSRSTCATPTRSSAPSPPSPAPHEWRA